MNYNEYPYGHDFGNSDTGGVTHLGGVVEARKMPSAILEGSYDDLERIVVGGSGRHNLTGVLGPKSHIVDVKGQSFYVGNLAIEQAGDETPIVSLTRRGDSDRYGDIGNLVLLLATACEMISDQEFGLSVVTGLPIAAYDDDRVRQIKTALDGHHEAIIDGRMRTIHVSVKTVLMEGAGANLAHGSRGQQKVGVIDIGGRTTDLYAATGIKPVGNMCKSLDMGVETAFDELCNEFERIFRYSLSASDGSKLPQCYLNRTGYADVATIANAKADPRKVDDLIGRLLHGTAKNIIANIKHSWRSSLAAGTVAGDMSEVMLIGGGAYYFEGYIRSVFGDRLIVPSKPEYANALGYARLAQVSVQRTTNRQVS